MNYDAALDRAVDALLGERLDAGERLSVPDPEGQTDGAFTRLTNLEASSTALSRDPEHIHSTIQRDLGTNGQFDGSTARYNGSFSVADFQAAIDAYVTEFVTCSECGLPDTRLVTEDGVDRLRCEACGAFRPVSKSTNQSSTVQTEDVESGRTYQVEITGTGREGDGVAKKNGYTIFVSGAREGQVVTAYIESISGTLAFGRVQ